jgi:branched-chain amino acid transport system permease protein
MSHSIGCSLACPLAAVGAIQAWWLTYIDPPSMFDLGLSIKAFVILLLGGAGTVCGPVLGAFVVELLANLTWSKLLNWHLGAMGPQIMGIILVFPDGFGAALRRGGWLARRRPREVASPKRQDRP